MNIVIVGLGYVGLANALFFNGHHNVVGYDVDDKKRSLIRQKICPITDASLVDAFNKSLSTLNVVDNPETSYQTANIIIIATPTDYSTSNCGLDISSVESTIKDILKVNQTAEIIIRSTLPLGTTDKFIEQFKFKRIAFIPEFLREGSAFSDTLRPDRLVIGACEEDQPLLKSLFLNSLGKACPIILTTPKEAEAIKLFANSYLAMRIAFFNELDNLANANGLNSNKLIEAIGLDSRIGNGYNNPSFGFSGYCLPKDIKQLTHDFGEVPHVLLSSITKSNEERINYIVSLIMEKHPQVVGIYRLTMKAGSDNMRQAVISEVMKLLEKQNVNLIIYEPLIKETHYQGHKVINELQVFIAQASLIVANRSDDLIKSAKEKLFTRDIFHTDK